MKDLAVIVLAAGKGTRMKSETPKVLHRIAGRPMLFYPLEVLRRLRLRNVVVVLGHGAERVKEEVELGGVDVCVQRPQLGTGHAVMCALKGMDGFRGDVLVLSGDTPLITSTTLKGFLRFHRRGRRGVRPALSLITTLVDNPTGYGRIVRDRDGAVERIVEERDATSQEREIREINTGIYLISSDFLFENIHRLERNNNQSEYYLTDLIHLAVREGRRVSALTHVDPHEVMGINNRIELATACRIMRTRIANELMLNGVTIMDPEVTYIDYGVRVGVDTVLYPGVHLLGDTVVGRGCTVEEGVRIQDSRIGDGTTVRSYSVIEASRIGRDVMIGPFARLRPGNNLMDRVRVGNFVEVKNTRIGRGTKANHLTYLGDSVIGKDVNIGAGTITCNYDGVKKHQTVIEDGAFIGSDTQLVAPVRVRKNAYIGSGSTITRDVPGYSLALSRVEQRIIKDWVKKKGLKG